ncbi:hypothetical protein Tco_0731882 [Tanacetum coccineum]
MGGGAGVVGAGRYGGCSGSRGVREGGVVSRGWTWGEGVVLSAGGEVVRKVVERGVTGGGWGEGVGGGGGGDGWGGSGGRCGKRSKGRVVAQSNSNSCRNVVVLSAGGTTFRTSFELDSSLLWS